MKLQLRKYSTRSSRMALHSMQQELGFSAAGGTYMRQWWFSSACVRTSDISWKGSVRPEVSSAQQLQLKTKVSIYLNEIKQIMFILPKTKTEQFLASTFRCGFCSSSSLWWFAWVEPRSCPSQLASMHPRVSVLNLKSCVAPKILAQQLSN